jgi:hypothetical protein
MKKEVSGLNLDSVTNYTEVVFLSLSIEMLE